MRSNAYIYNVRRILFLLLLLCVIGGVGAETREVRLKLIETSDIHGNYFPYDFINQREGEGGMSRICAYVMELRRQYADNLLLLDNGDILQGQPSAYYYNYIDTVSTHLCADIMNFMGYDAAVIGNHDIETGAAVYNKWREECQFPVLGANILADIGNPVFPPYISIEREGVKVVVLGMITPAIPVWMHEEMWRGYLFEDMEVCARLWITQIREKEQPDVLIGLFHTGGNARTLLDRYREDAALEIAERVPGFDVIMYGHDHEQLVGEVTNIAGEKVVVINPGFDATAVGEIDITLWLEDGKVKRKEVQGTLVDVKDHPSCEDFLTRYADQYAVVRNYVSRKIGTVVKKIGSRDAYFGASAYVDFIHRIQLDVTGADISLAAPLSFDVTIPQGDICVGDLFNFYKYENYLYTMRLTGREIRLALEESYDRWVGTMQAPEDNLILFADNNQSYLANYYYLFDSAAGIRYAVDVTQPKGRKVAILNMADGSLFQEDKMYDVVVNSYRGSGGGETLVKGTGLSLEELRERIVSVTVKDIRYYLMEYILTHQVIEAKPLDQWEFIPAEWVKPAIERDYRKLFSN